MTKDNSSNNGCFSTYMFFAIIWILSTLIHAWTKYDSPKAYFSIQGDDFFHYYWERWEWFLDSVLIIAVAVCCFLFIIRPIIRFFGRLFGKSKDNNVAVSEAKEVETVDENPEEEPATTDETLPKQPQEENENE